MRGLSNARFLPATISLIAVLLGVKAITLTETALAGETGAGGQAQAGGLADKHPDRVTLPPVASALIVPHGVRGHLDVGKEMPDQRLAEDLQREKAAMDRERSALDAREAATLEQNPVSLDRSQRRRTYLRTRSV